jgi:hypothetical protein
LSASAAKKPAQAPNHRPAIRAMSQVDPANSSTNPRRSASFDVQSPEPNSPSISTQATIGGWS